MATIAVVDDDFALEALVDSLRFAGHDAIRYKSAQAALESVDEVANSDVVVLDIIMECPDSLSEVQARGGYRTGQVLLAKLREKNPSLPVLVLSATRDRDLINEVSSQPNTLFLAKWDAPTPGEVLAAVAELLGQPPPEQRPQAFIVHGQDEVAKLALKNYLQNTLGFPEPVVLHEAPSLGRTIIEKFEDEAANAALVFVLLTPDDVIAPIGAADDEKRRARQNVIFEMGYFLGVLGRTSGRVFLLYKAPLELPSDMCGVIYIDIAEGIDAAGEAIRKELSHVI